MNNQLLLCKAIAILIVSQLLLLYQCQLEPRSSTKIIKTTDKPNGRDRLFSEISSISHFKTLSSLCTSNSTNSTGNPSVVYLSVYVRSISSINSESMDYVVDLYLQQQWHDDRQRDEKQLKAINYSDRKKIQKVWKPEIIFTNSKDSHFQYVTIPNMLMRVEPNGDVLYILRLKVKFDCMMAFHKYPMDKQTCSMELSTFAKTNDELQLRWASEIPITMYEKLKLSQFTISSVSTYHCNITYYFGQYSCLKAEFNLERELSYHLVQSYFSTSLIVVISWLSFWLNLDAVAARITLGVTTLLTISSKGVGIENKLPPVTYLKAIDVWIFICTTFVFAALLEFSVANYVWRIELAKREQMQQKACLPIALMAERIDHQSRILFPTFFLVFALFYWLYYCCWI